MAYRRLAGLEGGIVYEYTSSIGEDRAIAREAALVVSAHILHLHEQGIIDDETLCSLAPAVRELLENPHAPLDAGNAYEDIWEAIEAWLTEKAGDAAREVWIGRSRNDHVSAALRLHALQALAGILEAIHGLRAAILDKARGSSVWIPLHTHQQPSQLAPAHCLLQSWEEALSVITRLYHAAAGLVDRSPLGAAAGAGTMAPLSSQRLARLLGFSGPLGNPVYATGSRLDLNAVAMAHVLLLTELARMAEDLILLSSPYTGIARLPDGHVATSSLMPHKRNPATLEVLRARAKIGIAQLAAILTVQAGLPSGYSLDLQELNRLYHSLEQTALEALKVLTDLVRGLEWDEERIAEITGRYTAYGGELAEAITLDTGTPFRHAYRIVSQHVRHDTVNQLLRQQGYETPLDLVRQRKTGCTETPILEEREARLEDDKKWLDRLRARLDPGNTRKQLAGMIQNLCQR